MPRIGAVAMPMKKRVLILQAGNTEPAVAAKLGDYPEWGVEEYQRTLEDAMIRGLGVPRDVLEAVIPAGSPWT